MIEITNYKVMNKGILVAFINIKIKKWGNFLINDISYFKKGDQRWISFPSRQYEKDGVKKYAPYCRFEDSEMMQSFQEIILKSIDKWIQDHPENKVEAAEKFNEEFPF